MKVKSFSWNIALSFTYFDCIATPVQKYKSPGTVRYPIGDEELNNHLFDEGGINEAMPKHDKLNEFGLKCKNFELTSEYQVRFTLRFNTLYTVYI